MKMGKTMPLAPLLRIGRGVTAIIGGGGKTTLLYMLTEELRKKGSVLLCTSAHIRIPEQYRRSPEGRRSCAGRFRRAEPSARVLTRSPAS